MARPQPPNAVLGVNDLGASEGAGSRRLTRLAICFDKRPAERVRAEVESQCRDVISHINSL